MTKKFEVTFSSQSINSPTFVYVSPSESYQGHFNVAVLYVKEKFGSQRSFDLKQNLLNTEGEAIEWAKNWIRIKSNCEIELSEVEDLHI